MPRIAGRCNLCGWPVIRWSDHVFGNRCIRCLSTQIHRAAGFVIDSLGVSPSSRVYELSSRGALHRYLKSRFRNFYCSEFFDDVPPGDTRNGVPCQDVQNLMLPDNAFDLVTCTEVFEHVPDDAAGFSEIHRILSPGGWLVFTVPITGDFATVERALIQSDGSVRHLLPQVYHSDRIRGAGKVLAYRNYGRDVVVRVRGTGFASEMRIVRSERSMIKNCSVIVARKEPARCVLSPPGGKPSSQTRNIVL